MKSLFSIEKKIDVPRALVIVPSAPRNFSFPTEPWIQRRKIFGSELLISQRFAVLTGFLGYPYLYLLLERLRIEPSLYFFLGTAGAIDPSFRRPALVQVEETFASPPMARLAKTSSFRLITKEDQGIPVVRGVSVDIIQRETKTWLERQLRRGTQVVDMELFALAAYIKKPFSAFLCLTDRVTPDGIRPFAEKAEIPALFESGYSRIRRLIDETESTSGPSL